MSLPGVTIIILCTVVFVCVLTTIEGEAHIFYCETMLPSANR